MLYRCPSFETPLRGSSGWGRP